MSYQGHLLKMEVSIEKSICLLFKEQLYHISHEKAFLGADNNHLANITKAIAGKYAK